MRTLDSGQRREWDTGARRDTDDDKPRYEDLSVAGWNATRDLGSGPLDISRDGSLYVGHDFDKIPIAMPPDDDSFIHHLFTARLEALLLRGAQKYGAHNWMKGIPPHVYWNSAMRHLLQLRWGDRREDHEVAVAFNMMGSLVTNRLIVDGERPADLVKPQFGLLGW